MGAESILRLRVQGRAALHAMQKATTLCLRCILSLDQNLHQGPPHLFAPSCPASRHLLHRLLGCRHGSPTEPLLWMNPPRQVLESCPPPPLTLYLLPTCHSRNGLQYCPYYIHYFTMFLSFPPHPLPPSHPFAHNVPRPVRTLTYPVRIFKKHTLLRPSQSLSPSLRASRPQCLPLSPSHSCNPLRKPTGNTEKDDLLLVPPLPHGCQPIDQSIPVFPLPFVVPPPPPSPAPGPRPIRPLSGLPLKWRGQRPSWQESDPEVESGGKPFPARCRRGSLFVCSWERGGGGRGREKEREKEAG